MAFLVATGSLLVQGGTLAWVIRRLNFPPPDREEFHREHDARVKDAEVAALALLGDPELRQPDGTPYEPEMLDRLRERVVSSPAEDTKVTGFRAIGELLDRVFDAQRKAVMSARADGVYSAEALADALRRIDSLQLAMQIAAWSRESEPG